MIAICLLLTASTGIGIIEYFGAEKEKDKKMAISLIGICVCGLFTLSMISTVLG
jgi:hypothetical protein